MPQLVHRVGRKALSLTGFSVQRAADPFAGLVAAGLAPRTILDVGAALGDWSRAAAKAFPGARVVLVEPLAEFAPLLRSLAGTLGRAEVVEAAAGAQAGERTFNVHEDLVGSSLLHESEGPHVDGVPRDVRVVALDQLAAELELAPPYVLKLDVQGAELDALAGATSVVEDSLAVQVEVSFFPFFEGGATFGAIVAALREHALVVYDVLNLSRRPLDGALAQADLLFVPETSPARRAHAYATPAQRARQNEQFAASIRRRIERGE
jgi:FkbM family methyltransferase